LEPQGSAPGGTTVKTPARSLRIEPADAETSGAERRKYPRVQAPVLFRPVGRGLFRARESTVDLSLGGARVYSDDLVEQGRQLEIELFLRDGTSIACAAIVVWVERLPAGAPAVYDVGLRFVGLDGADRERLAAVLEAEAADDLAAGR